MKYRTFAMTLVAASWAGTSMAQSQVSIYGIADACLARSNAGASTVTAVNSGCQAGSRLGFRGTEDLGDGYAAYFTLENGFNIDNGSMGQGGLIFGRKALLGLSSPKLGSIELGRDYAPTFYALAAVDPTAFGIGTISNTVWTGSNPTTVARNDNAVNYISPALGPVTVRFQYSLGEQAAPAAKSGRNTTGINAMYRSGNWVAGLAYARHNNPADTGSDKATTVVVGRTLGALTLSGALQAGAWEGSRTTVAPSSATSIFSRNYRSYMLGGTYQITPFFRTALSIKRYDDRTVGNFDAGQWTVIGFYALSKRTELYAAYSKLKNVSASSYAIGDATTTYGNVAAGASTSLMAMGVRHSF